MKPLDLAFLALNCIALSSCRRDGIWGSSDAVIEPVTRDFSSGPFPSFVAVFGWTLDANGNPARPSMCGGTLFNRSFVLTTKHCFTNLGEGIFQFRAYLNPHYNPTLWLAGQQHVNDVLLQDQARGLGVELKLAQCESSLCYGIACHVHPFDDLAVLTLEAPPFPDDFPHWSFFDASIGGVHSGGASSLVRLLGFGIVDSQTWQLGLVKDWPMVLQEQMAEVISTDRCTAQMVSWLAEIVEQNPTLGGNLSKSQEDFLDKAKEHAETKTRVARQLWKRARLLIRANKDGMGTPTTSSQATRLGLSPGGSDVSRLRELNQAILNHEGSPYHMQMQKMGKMLCTYSPEGGAQPGDSGGPLVSDRHEILGFVLAGVGKANLIQDKARNREQRVSSFALNATYFRPWLELLAGQDRSHEPCKDALCLCPPERHPRSCTIAEQTAILGGQSCRFFGVLHSFGIAAAACEEAAIAATAAVNLRRAFLLKNPAVLDSQWMQDLFDLAQLINSTASSFLAVGSNVTLVKDQLNVLGPWLRTLNQAAAYGDGSTLESAMAAAKPSEARSKVALQAAQAGTEEMRQVLEAAHEVCSRASTNSGGKRYLAAEAAPDELAELRSYVDAAMPGIQAFGDRAEVAVKACSKAVVDGGEAMQLIGEAFAAWTAAP